MKEKIEIIPIKTKIIDRKNNKEAIIIGVRVNEYNVIEYEVKYLKQTENIFTNLYRYQFDIKNRNTHLILKTGTLIRTKLSKIEVIIIGCFIDGESVEYKTRYFNNGDECIAWLKPYELELKSNNNIGYKQETITIKQQNNV